MSTIEDITVRLTGFKSINIGKVEDGMDISLHLMGGHVWAKLTRTEGLALLEAIKTVMEEEPTTE